PIARRTTTRSLSICVWARNRTQPADAQLEHVGPTLSGDVIRPGGRVIGNAIRYFRARRALPELAGQVAHVQPANDLARRRIDDGDAVGRVDVGQDQAIDVFKLVQTWQRPCTGPDLHTI